eukprot:3114610-Alexandrium_andersonii.AAC.1
MIAAQVEVRSVCFVTGTDSLAPAEVGDPFSVQLQLWAPDSGLWGRRGRRAKFGTGGPPGHP